MSTTLALATIGLLTLIVATSIGVLISRVKKKSLPRTEKVLIVLGILCILLVAYQLATYMVVYATADIVATLFGGL